MAQNETTVSLLKDKKTTENEELKEIIESETKSLKKFEQNSNHGERLDHLLEYLKKLDEKINEVHLLVMEPKYSDGGEEGELKNYAAHKKKKFLNGLIWFLLAFTVATTAISICAYLILNILIAKFVFDDLWERVIVTSIVNVVIIVMPLMIYLVIMSSFCVHNLIKKRRN